MTNPKTPESRAVASRTKPAAPAPTTDRDMTTTSTSDNPPSPDPSHGNGDQAKLLEQLVTLTQSISNLVQQNTDASDDKPPPRSPEETRVVFAYDFLGVVLGRRDPRVFQLRTVGVTRNERRLTFTDLKGATVAKVRGANNGTQLLEGLRDNEPATIRTEGDNAIPDQVEIDSIVILSARDGVPVAIGPCQPPVPGGLVAPQTAR
jgi:hypothetical protein